MKNRISKFNSCAKAVLDVKENFLRVFYSRFWKNGFCLGDFYQDASRKQKNFKVLYT
jgi:hypothetical protein